MNEQEEEVKGADFRRWKAKNCQNLRPVTVNLES
jgi:hypothetical protein